MKLKIDTPKGLYVYKFRPVYEGVKLIDKIIAKENLLLFNKLAKAHNLEFCLIYGTLLGALREHDFITHDEDIDLGVLYEHLDIFKSMLFELRDNGFEVIRYDRRDGLCSIMRKGEYIDLYFLKKTCKGIRDALGESLPEKYVTDLVEIEFQGEKFLAARDAEESMFFCYGPNWKTPVQWCNFGMPWYKIRMIKFMWWGYYKLPDFIFFPWMKHREIKKYKQYNNQATKLNAYLGREEVPLIDIDSARRR